MRPLALRVEGGWSVPSSLARREEEVEEGRGFSPGSSKEGGPSPDGKSDRTSGP